MAFPTSPVDNEIYGEYIYNSTIGAWEKISTENNKGIKIDDGCELQYDSVNDALDFVFGG